ncbi:MAG: esterase/lipase family protein, partial [Nevskiales bacterium]
MCKHLRLISLFATALALGACKGSDSDSEIFLDNPATAGSTSEPKLETDTAKLDAALKCTPFAHPDKPPVLLVHGTFTNGPEQYNWTYLPLLIERGFDVCLVSYPDRGLGDQQISAEYVVHALRRIHAESGRKVAMIGHSQGAAMPRWALKWWPSARAAVEDFVLQAGPNHGSNVASRPPLIPELLGLPAALYQVAPDSDFVAAVNRDDETPGEVSYTSLYTQFDELVQPVAPVPTAALDWGLDNPKVSNVLLQDLCPGRFVDHVTIGLTDRLAFELTLDAISHPGPANIERAGGVALCGLLPLLPDQIFAATFLTDLLGV